MARTGQHSWLCPRRIILPTRMGCSSNTKLTRREDRNVSLMPVKPQYYCVRQMRHFRRFCDVARHSSSPIEFIMLCLYSNNNRLCGGIEVGVHSHMVHNARMSCPQGKEPSWCQPKLGHHRLLASTRMCYCSSTRCINDFILD